MPITITTTSSTSYASDKDNAIYPAFVDNMPYEAWNSGSTISTSRTQYFQLKAAGGSDYTWSLVGGSLPDGLSISSLGRISGIPTKIGTFTFSVKATSESESATKSLTFVAHEYRSKWYTDAKFGIFINWGRFVYPKISTVTGTTEFIARATEFDAEEWGDQMEDMGAKILHFSALYQDSYRNWPSTTPTNLQLKSSRNFVAELKTACDSRGIKMITYYPPDYNFNPQEVIDRSSVDNTWGTMNTGLVREIVVDLGLDGMWVDVGGASDFYPDTLIDPSWFKWDNIIPIIRYNNPFFIFCCNAGIGQGGKLLQYPHADFITYEGVETAKRDGFFLEKASPVLPDKKRMAIDITQMLSEKYATVAPEVPQSVKDVDDFIENIKQNWKAGATVMMNFPVVASGKLIDDVYADAISRIGSFVVANQGRSVEPRIFVVSDQVVISSPNKSRIYYTVDGTDPDETSRVYTRPFPAIVNTTIKAISIESDNNASTISQYYKPSNVNSPYKNRLFSNSSFDSEVVDFGRQYHGMMITIKDSDITINAVGRKNIGVPGDRPFFIRRVYDSYPVYAGILTAAGVIIDSYRYAYTPDITLSAGMSYYVAIKEVSGSAYARNPLNQNPSNPDVAILSPIAFNPQGDLSPYVDTSFGQLINFRYKIEDRKKELDLAIGAKGVFVSNITGNILSPSKSFISGNAIDGDDSSLSMPTGEYGYIFKLDLKSIKSFSRLEVLFGENLFSTEFTLSYSLDDVNLVELKHVYRNEAKKININFNTVRGRYVYFKAIKPNLPNEKGDQMGIRRLSVYYI